jgi:hypothetical protein
MNEAIDIGHGVRISFVVNSDGDRCGIHERHNCNGDTEAGHWVGFRGVAGGAVAPSWAVESMEPLTLSPSILCRTCGHHGFIREGKWVPA